MRSRWDEIQTWERETGFTHPDHDIELRRDERRKTTVSFLFAIGMTIGAAIWYGYHG